MAIFSFNDRESVSVFPEYVCMCVYKFFCPEMSMKQTCSNFRIICFVCFNDNTDFEISGTKPVSLGSVFYEQSHAGRGRWDTCLP